MRIPKHDVLIFDIECRPTAWIGGDYVGRSMTAWAATWLDSDEVDHGVLTRETKDIKELVLPIAGLIDAADVVVGHYIRGFDLPVIQADLERAQDPTLLRTMSVDTKIDRIKTLGLSESLENLVARHELMHEKIPMHEPLWEEHNLWQTPRSVEWVRTRVVGDVKSTKELYLKLEELGRLQKPKPWDPTAAKLPRYRA